MEENKQEFATIEEYILMFPVEVQEKLQKLRRFITDLAPEAQEKISWRMPTFDLHGNLVHFAVFKKHIGLYPGSSGVEHFLDRLTEYKTSKGAIQFPIDKPLPYDLIRDIVLFRVSENMQEFEKKAQKKK